MIKKLFLFLIALGLLAGIAAGLVLLNLNPIIEKFKPQINAKISQATGQDVSLGDVSVQFLPQFGLVVKEITLGEADQKSVINKVLLKAGLSEMMTGNVSVSKLELSGGQIHLKRKTDGSIEVAGIPLGKKKSGDSSAETVKQTTEESNNTASANTEDKSKLSFKLEEAEVKDLTVSFQDKKTKPAQNIQITDLDIKVSEIDLAGSGKFSANFSLLGKKSDNFQISGELSGIPKGNFIPEGLSKISVSSLDLNRLSKLMEAYKISPKGLSIANELSLELNSKLKGMTPSADLGIDASNAAITFGDSFNKASGETFRINSSSDIALGLKPTVDLKSFSLNLGKILLTGKAQLKNGKADKVSVSSKSLPLTELAKFLPATKNFDLSGSSSFTLDLKPASAKKSLTINGKATLEEVSLTAPMGSDKLPVQKIAGELDFQGNSLSSKNLDLFVAEHPFKISATIKNFSAPIADFNLGTDSLDLGKFMAAIGKPNQALNGSTLGGLKLQGNYGSKTGRGKVNIVAGKSQIDKVPLDSVKMKLDIAPGLIKLEPSTISPFGGQLNLSGSISQGSRSALKANVNGNNFDSAVISKTFLPNSKISLTGMIESVTANIAADMARLVPSASGSVNTKVGQGAIEGINILGETLAGIPVIPGLGSKLVKYIPEENQNILKASNTAFDSLTFDSKLKDGRLNIRSFSLNHSLYRLDGDGWIGVGDGSKRIQARVRLTAKMAQGMIERKPKLALIQDSDGGIVVPIMITAKPGGRTLVLPDAKDLITRAGRNTAKQAISRELEKVAPGLGGAANMIDGLFGGKKSKTPQAEPSEKQKQIDLQQNPKQDLRQEPSKKQESNPRRNSNTLEGALEGAASKALEGLFGR